MCFLAFISYVVATYVYPGELFPVLQPYRLTLWIGLFALVTVFFKRLARTTLPMPLQLQCLLAFVATIAVSAVVVDHWFGGALIALEDFAPSLLMFVLALWNIESFRHLRIICTVVVLLSLALSIQGIAAYHFGYKTDRLLFAETVDPDDNAPVNPENRILRIRGLGIMNDPNDLALGLVSALPLVSLAWRRRRFVWNVSVVMIPLAILLYGIFLTHSRGAVLSVLLVVLSGMSSRMGRMRGLVVTVIVAVGLTTLNFSAGRSFSSGEESAAGRVAAWSEGLQMLKESPLFGVGYHEFIEHNSITAHNSFVLCFAELGLVGYFFWIALLATSIIDLNGVCGTDSGCSEESWHLLFIKWGKALRLSLIGLLAAAFFLSRTYVITLYLVLGVCTALAVMARTAGKLGALPPPIRLTRLISAWELGSIAFMYVFIRLNGAFIH
jgi:putative inorganic carbon (hco3(-)) transporter